MSISGDIVISDVEHPEGNCRGEFTANFTNSGFSCSEDCDIEIET